MANPKKIEQIEALKKILENNKNFVVTDYRGLSVEQITLLRKKLRENNIVYHVTKNNLFKIAVQDSQSTELDKVLFGPTAVAFTSDKIVEACKILVDESKDSNLKVKGGFAEGRFLNDADVLTLSKLPSKDVLFAQLLGALQSPLTKTALLLKSPMQKLTYTLKALADNKS